MFGAYAAVGVRQRGAAHRQVISVEGGEDAGFGSANAVIHPVDKWHYMLWSITALTVFSRLTICLRLR